VAVAIITENNFGNMIQSELFDKNVGDYEAWYEQHAEVYESEIIAIREQISKLPENIRGIEVGLGTGRFTKPLGIKEGIEPSESMAARARARGIEVMDGLAENLPYADLQFDFVLFVTICHLRNLRMALAEAHRVLKHQGALIIGFLDKDRPIAQSYIEKRDRSTFYAQADFYTVSRLDALIKEAGFLDPEYNQTLFGSLDDIREVQMPKPSHGEGSFVVVKAIKK
jgi:SAM-dependent methyltransferase